MSRHTTTDRLSLGFFAAGARIPASRVGRGWALAATLLLSWPAAALENGTFADGLTGWTIVERGGGADPGSVVAVTGGAELRERSSFLVTLSQTFLLPKYAKTLTFTVSPAPGFDVTASGIPDAFEVALLGPDGTSVLPTWQNGATAAWGVDERATQRLASGASALLGVGSLDVSGLATGATVTLVFSLIGGDTDPGSAIRVSGVGFELSNRPPVADAGSDRTAECGEAATLVAASTDPDGDTLTHTWTTEGGDVLGTGPVLQVESLVGESRYRLTSQDPGGLSASALISVTVVDTRPPTLSALPDLVVVDADGSCLGAVPNLVGGAVATDACTGAVLGQDLPPLTPIPLGDNTVVISARDADGNETSHTVVVRVEDREKPLVVSTDAPAFLSAGESCEAEAPAVIVVAKDNCTPAGELIVGQLVPTGSSLGLGGQVLGVTVKDLAGNVADPAEATVDVVDTTPPIGYVASGVTLEADGATCRAALPDLSSKVVATDNCGASVVVTPLTAVGDLLAPGERQVSFTLTDAAGNGGSVSGTVTVRDVDPPSLTTAAVVDVIADETCSGSVPALAMTATDGCGAVITSQSVPAGTALTFGASTAITATARDTGGLETNQQVSVSLKDEAAPVLTGPAAYEVVADAECSALLPDLTTLVSAKDNCAAVDALSRSQKPSVGSALVFGTSTALTVTVADGHGNESNHVVSVNAKDEDAPVVSLPETAEVAIFAGCSGAVPDVGALAEIDDGCSARSALVVQQSVTAGTPLATGEARVVTLTVTDPSGNRTEVATTLLGKDAGAPTVELDDLAEVAADGNCQGQIGDRIPTALGDCSVVTVVQDPAPDAAMALGQDVAVTVTVTDAQGNATSDTMTVRLVDRSAPVIVPLDVDVELAADVTCKAVAPDLTAGATVVDNCPLAEAPVVSSSVAIGAPVVFGVGLEATLSAEDAAGNVGTAPVAITLVDLTPPTIELATPSTEVLADETCAGVLPAVLAVAKDNCDPAPALSQTPAPGATMVLGTPIGVALAATDASGNIADSETTANLVDVTPPTGTLLVPGALTAGAGCSVAMPSLEVSLSDNCGGASVVSQSPAVGAAVGLGTNPVLVNVLDGAGLSLQLSGSIDVTDSIPPMVEPLAARTVDADEACAGVVPDLTTGLGHGDNCAGATLSQAPAAGTPLTFGAPTSVTVTVTDAAGAEATTTAVVTLKDVTPPTAGFDASSILVPADAACQGFLPDLSALATIADNCAAPGQNTTSQTPEIGAFLTLDTAEDAQAHPEDGVWSDDDIPF